MSSQESPLPLFSQLGLSPQITAALDAVGYESPTAIQAETIPLLLEGRDLIGQAQTGTGKTAAFALPILDGIDLARAQPQALVLAPTRELAIQVAEAFQRYASHLKGFHVLPIYGGQDYGIQLRALKRGVHVVVGTPGRVMDHMRRETLELGSLKYLVLDEADEMLRMGFIDDVEWILGCLPEQRQIALFSATMPNPIRKIAEHYLKDPAEVSIRLSTQTAETIRHRFCKVVGPRKLDAITRVLEVEDFEAVLIFVRTKNETVELAERLEARGYACAAINGDMPQKARERTIDQLKQGKLDLLVATDVAARGLDVERITHVINYDIPYDPEAYVHRVGRTGRAGRHGEAILFVTQREMRMLNLIEKVTRQRIEHMELPSVETINDSRRARFMQAITDTMMSGELDPYVDLVTEYQREHDADPLAMAAALARLAQGDEPLLLEAARDQQPYRERSERAPRHERFERGGRHERPGRPARDERPPRSDWAAQERSAPRRDHETGRARDEWTPGQRPPLPPRRDRDERPARGERTSQDRPSTRFASDAAPPRGDWAPGERPPPRRDREARPRLELESARPRRDDARADYEQERPRRRLSTPEAGMELFRLEVGHEHGVKPGNIVGAIANEAGLDSRSIGRVEIYDDYSTVALPEGMPKEILHHLKRVWVASRPLGISRMNEGRPSTPPRRDNADAKPRKKDRHRDRKNKGAPRKP